MGARRTPDEILGAQDHSVGLTIRMLPAELEDEDDYVLLSGSREALRLLGDVLHSLAESDELPASIQMGPHSAGRFHLSSSTEVGMYLLCSSADHDSLSPEAGGAP